MGPWVTSPSRVSSAGRDDLVVPGRRELAVADQQAEEVGDVAGVGLAGVDRQQARHVERPEAR